jgi:uncharacterized protein
MSPMLDLESDLEALDDLLWSDQMPDDSMRLSELDGFLTGLAVGPQIVPPSEWLPVIWGGGEEPSLDDALQARALIDAVMARHDAILEQIADGVVDPVFVETRAGEVVALDWTQGFMQAIGLRAEAWEKLFRSERHAHLTLPILALCSDEEGEPLLALDKEDEDRFFAEACELIPPAILAIAEFWRAARSSPQRRPAGPKTGRNDPCPCGSGKKFKKCCGAEG